MVIICVFAMETWVPGCKLWPIWWQKIAYRTHCLDKAGMAAAIYCSGKL